MFNAQLTKWLGVKKLSTFGEKDKFPPIQKEAGQIWTAAAL